jgi:beta-glucosidase
MTTLKSFHAVLALCAMVLITSGASSPCSAKNTHQDFGKINERKIDKIIAAMTLEEKIAMTHKDGMFTSAGIPRLGIPALKSADGPFGVREELEYNSWKVLGLTTDSATFFPTGSALAATWNPAMAYQYGVGLGQETWSRGKDVILGPAINITRTPVNGRTFEYMSEDPLLNSRIVVGYINGVQSTGVASCVKHFAVNNQETNRGAVDVRVGERALREIYLPAFKAAVEDAHVRCLMSAYNKVNGQYCGENKFLLTTVAKGEWGFKGLVMSDWGGTHSTVDAAMNGLDIEMGSDKYFTQPLFEAVKAGTVPVSVIDEKARRILRVILYSLKTAPAPATSVIATRAHAKIAYDIASQSIVLLKNSAKLLPLSAHTVKTIAVIGDNATHKHQSGGFGAGVKARSEVTPLAGLMNRVGKTVAIKFAQGYEPKFLKNTQWGKRTIDTTVNRQLIDEAVVAAKAADVAVIFAGTNHDVETEATDRTALTLPFGQDELIKAVTAANPKTIVVVVAGAPVDMQTINGSASAILYSWFNGSEGGNALADVLFGAVNHSGKLPLTFPAALKDSPAHALGTFPGDSTATYAEGILVGYRWFDTKKIDPAYCFGHGLSYTDFAYSNVKTDKQSYRADEKIRISVNVKNTGSVPGAEVVQIYVSDMDPKVMKAAKELKAFRKVLVPKGATIAVTLEINASDLAWFNETDGKWVVSPGKYAIHAGSSSRDIRASAAITIN